MDLRYELYLRSDCEFYYPNVIDKEETKYIIKDIPDSWIDELDSSQHWRYLSPNPYFLPPQGWKIHITSTLEQSQETLNRVSSFLFQEKIAFKFVFSHWDLAFKNSKYGDRSSSGKFITIYPPTEYVFLYLLEKLSSLLFELDKGVYILNDNRWENSNVFFRYGAFVEMQTSDGQPAILNEKNEFIPDLRLPYYNVPDFVSIPIKIQEMELKKQKSMETVSDLDNYEIIDVLHFSNGGGVYKAFSKLEEKIVILKEGRLQAGLDGQSVDSYTRIDTEFKNLSSLKNVETVVNVIEKFRVWEHNYLVEDFIDGVSLNSWIANHYPFIAEESDIEAYSEKVKTILDKVVRGIEKIHAEGIGIGDLSPSNILVISDSLEIKFIDFEVAGKLKSSNIYGLKTPGYSTVLSKNREESDWFSCLRIAYSLLMPISPINDISLYNETKMDWWIKNRYPVNIFNYLVKLKERVYSYFPSISEELQRYNLETVYDNFELVSVVQKLRQGLLNNLNCSQPSLLPGDIRQYEMSGGMLNVFTGSFGVILALYRTGSVPPEIHSWLRKYSAPEFIDSLDGGLFTGKSGIACVLFELGYCSLATDILNSIDIDSISNISLFTGLSGIGLAYLSFYSMTQEEKYLSQSKTIALRIAKSMELGISLESVDPDFIPMGLLEGWSGSVLLFVSLYRVTQESQWLEYAEKAMDLELENCEMDSSNLLNIKDDFRFLPYLAGGSVGVGIALLILSKESSKSIYIEKFKQIEKVILTACSFSVGLFRGFGSFLLFYSLLKAEYGTISLESESLFKTLYVYLIEKDETLYVPGEFGYRISYDYFSGSAGLLLVLEGIINRNWKNWFPIMEKAIENCGVL